MKKAALVRFGWIWPLVVAAVMAGCESSSDSGSAIQVEPSNAELIGAGSVVFTAVVSTNFNLILPLEWSVDDPALGSISGNGGVTAVYVGNNRVGANTISVRDQLDRAGVAVVNQRAVSNQ